MHSPRGGTVSAGRSTRATSKETELLDVSCLSAGTCAVVGADDIGLCAYGYSDYFVPMFGFWRSGRWSLRQRPNLGCSNSSDSGGGNGLNAVSCT